jgi:hypothetical protein
LNKKIKITIEGWEEEPVVYENNEMFILEIQSDGKLGGGVYSDLTFLGYVAAKSQMEFSDQLKGNTERKEDA